MYTFRTHQKGGGQRERNGGLFDISIQEKNLGSFTKSIFEENTVLTPPPNPNFPLILHAFLSSPLPSILLPFILSQSASIPPPPPFLFCCKAKQQVPYPCKFSSYFLQIFRFKNSSPSPNLLQVENVERLRKCFALSTPPFSPFRLYIAFIFLFNKTRIDTIDRGFENR